jgi:hypothetical protein
MRNDRFNPPNARVAKRDVNFCKNVYLNLSETATDVLCSAD